MNRVLLSPLSRTVFFFAWISLTTFFDPTYGYPQNSDLTENFSNQYLNITGVIPLAEDHLKDKILFFFDKKINFKPNDPSNGFGTEPPVRGAFRTGSNFIEFTPADDAPKAFRVIFSTTMTSVDGKPVNPKQTKYTFRKDDISANVWIQNQTIKSSTIAVDFNFPVKIEDVKPQISILDYAKNLVPFEISPGPNDKTFSLSIYQEKINWPLEIAIVPPLKDTKDLVSMKYPYKHVFLFEKKTLNVENTFWQTVRDEVQNFDIDFSHKIKPQSLKEYLEIKSIPAGEIIPFEIISNEENKKQSVQINYDRSNLNIQVHIKKGLKGEEDRVLEQPYTTTFKEAAPAFSITNQYFGHYGKDGMGLEINTNIPICKFNKQEDLVKLIDIRPSLANVKVHFNEWNNNGFVIYGDWKGYTSYQVIFKKGVKLSETTALQKPIVRDVKTEQIQPFISFALEGQFYFPRRNQMRLPVDTRNVQEMKVTLFRLFPSNIPAAMRDLNEGKGSSFFNESWCEQIATKQVPVKGNSYEKVTTQLDLDQLFPQDKHGVFCLQASSGDYPQDTKVVLYTNMGLLSHWQNNELVVFAHDLFTLAPVPNAKVSVYSQKSQVLKEASTDASGIAQLKDFPGVKGTPHIIVVEAGEDFTFLELNNRSANLKEIPAGQPAYNRTGYDAFVYADRDLYRPGETIHASWIVRSNYGDAVANVPLLISVYKPNGKILFSKPTTLSALGTGTLDIETQKSFPTGKYDIQITVPGNANPLGNYRFNLEDFVPQQMKTTVTLENTNLKPAIPAKISIQANHLFGTPAAERKSTAKVVFKRGGFKSEKWPEFRFDNESIYTPEQVDLGEAWTDAEGKAEFNFNYTPPQEITFPMQAVVLGDVFELGGRPVTGKATATFFPSNTILGIAAVPGAVSGGITVYAAAITADESPALEIKDVTITLERETWDYYVRRYYDYNAPNFTKTYQTLEERRVSLQDGKGSIYFDVKDYGYYRVRINNSSTPVYSTLIFYCMGDRCNVTGTAEPGLIKIIADKNEYAVGETAKLKIESPFNGKGIVVVQGESIQKMIPVDIKDNTGEFEIPLEGKDYPNIWIEATVIHEIKGKQAQVYPFSSFAVTALKVNNPARKLNVTLLNLPQEIRPAQKTSFKIVVSDSQNRGVKSQVTLAAVDEGIHLITDYKSPDPYSYFARLRKPDLRMAHYYDRVVYDFEKLLPGGDMSDFLNRSIPPMENWIKPVALWSGIVTTDDSGNATVEMEIPEFNGQLRLVGVACTPTATGAGSQDIFVRRPYMLKVSIPRFMLPQDSIQSRAVLFNQTDKACQAVLQWKATGFLQETSGETTLNIPAKGENNFAINFQAKKLAGQGKIILKTQFKDEAGTILETLENEYLLPVSPPVAYQSRHRILALKAGESAILQSTDIIPNPRNKVDVTVSANSLVRLKDALSYLIAYPYGCVEQTTSRLLPLYLLRKNESLLKTTTDTRIDEFVQAGIDRLFSMQTMSGGLGYWTGASDPYPYGSVYALHFLTLVKNGREFELPKTNYDALVKYVRDISQDWSDSSDTNLFLRAYSLYVLALGGDADAIENTKRFDELIIPSPSRYLLAATLALNTKDKSRVDFYLTKVKTKPFNQREISDTLNSQIRNTAIEFMALRQIGGKKEEIVRLADKLISYLEQRRYGTTQETAFVVTALSDYLSDLSKGIITAEAQIKNPTGETVTIKGTDIYNASAQGEKSAFTVKNTGNSVVYISLTTHGIPKDVTTVPIADGMEIARHFFKGDKEMESPAFKQGDTYIVDIVLTCEKDTKNIIVADLLPAGFEVENPRLNADSVLSNELPEAVQPAFLELRDDRLVAAFNELSAGEHHYLYIVRAVTPGDFQYPPVQAECMYDLNVRAFSAAAKIHVE